MRLPLSGKKHLLPGPQPLGRTRLSNPLSSMASHSLLMQERIVKVMSDYDVMDEFLYNLTTDDFNDK